MPKQRKPAQGREKTLRQLAEEIANLIAGRHSPHGESFRQLITRNTEFLGGTRACLKAIARYASKYRQSK